MSIIERLLGKKVVVEAETAQANQRPKPQRPEWASKELNLPPWVKILADKYEKAAIHLEVDSAVAYPYWMDLLGFKELTQYNLEVAHQCIKLDVQAALSMTEHDMRFADKHIAVTHSSAPLYAQAQYPVGKSATVKNRAGEPVVLSGADLASRGLEARDHYIRIRGALPM